MLFYYHTQTKSKNQTLDDTLKTLIAYYEEEKKVILQSIKDYTEEWEYQMAYFHTQALFQVNSQLQTLYTLQDRGYRKKHWKEESIRSIENQLRRDAADYMHDYFTQRLHEEKEELEKLNKVQDPVVEPPNGGAWAETLNSLLAGRIKGYTLFLNQEEKIQIDFTRESKKLKAVIPYIKMHLKSEILFETFINVLHDLGFRYNKNNSRLILLLDGEREHIIKELNWRLAKIVFQFFDFTTLAGKSCIVIKP